MRPSQKGTRLNELRCFRQARTFTRKRIPKIRLLPYSSASKLRLGQNRRSRGRPVILDRDQRSIEMARLSYSDCPEELVTRNIGWKKFENRATCVGTERVHDVPQSPVSSPKGEPQRERHEEAPKKVSIGAETKILPEPKKKSYSDSKRKPGQHETSFWLRFDAVRKIVNFFGSLLGREMGKNEDDCRYERKKRSRGAKVSEAPRTVLLERQMRKLEEENRLYKRLLEDKLKKGRQMSSPLH